MTSTVAVIPARGGSKGLPRKNLANVAGKPLLAWSILQARESHGVDSVWVSSDSDEILQTADAHGALVIERPSEISDDSATSESAWIHALDVIESRGVDVSITVGMQATSPIREPSDIDFSLSQFKRDQLDSLLTVCEIEDFFMWRLQENGQPIGINHDFQNRLRRQVLEKRYLENGSFYLFKPNIIRTLGNRLGGKMGIYVMAKHKLFQVDNAEDVVLCEAIMRGYGLDK